MNNHLTLPGLDISCHSVSGLVDCSCWVGRSVNERRHGVLGGWGVRERVVRMDKGVYFWICSST